MTHLFVSAAHKSSGKTTVSIGLCAALRARGLVYGERLGKQGQLRLGCTAIIFDEHQRVLLTRRTDNGQWCLPGGAMDPGESAAEACEREFWEETGLRARVKRLVGVYSDPDQLVIFPDGNKVFVVALSFEAEITAQEALTVDLLRMMLPSAVIFGLSGLLMGILNSYQIFFIPALAPSMYQLGMILGVLLLSTHQGIYGLAWGVVIGATLHLALQVPVLVRQRGQYFTTLGLELPAVREVARLMGPRLLGVAVVQLNFWVNIWLASRQPEGSVTGVVVAFMLMLMPQAAIAQSIAIAALPTLHTVVLGIVLAFFLTADLTSPFLVIGATVTGLLTVILVD